LIKAVKNRKGIYEGYQQVLKGLKRPVDMAYADLDDDGDEDIVVAEFGNHTGSVSLFVKHHRNSYQRKVLLPEPGSVSIQIDDLDNDGKKDIVVLMAQGDEGIDIYFNQGGNNFERKRILRFPPTYGSSSVSLVDMNQDGYKDMVYVNGDNADASQILKPYHGIHIFINDGHNRFIESYFYQFPGAYKALIHDFDNDGDADIAAISFFPDFVHHPENGFVYLKNISKGDSLNFIPLTIEASKSGRWITMLGGDVNHDNHLDVLLGSFTSITIAGDTLNTMRSQYQKSSPLLFLEYVN
jgi:hypothetical protein